MPGKLDEISAAIGELRAQAVNLGEGINEIKKDIKDNRTIQSDRHGQNRRDIERLQRAVQQIAGRPQLAVPLGRGQMAAVGAIGMAIISFVVWLIENGVQWLWQWAKTHWH